MSTGREEYLIKFLEEEEAEERDLQMIAEAEAENNGGAISFEDMAEKLNYLHTDEK